MSTGGQEQHRESWGHTHIYPCRWGWREKGSSTAAMEYRALGAVGSRVKVSSAAGEQPLPAQPCGPGSSLAVAGESWPPESLGTIPMPRGGSSRLFSTTRWVCQGLNLGHLPLPKLGMCGSCVPQLPWLSVGAQQHGAQLAVGSFTPAQGTVPAWGGLSCPGRWHSRMKHCPLAGQVPQPPLQFARAGPAALSPIWSTGMWVHAHSQGTHSSEHRVFGLFPSGGNCLAWDEG